MMKFCKAALTTVLAIVCIAAISISTLLLKARYDQAIEAAVQARLSDRSVGAFAGLTMLDPSNSADLPRRERVASSDRDVNLARSIIDEDLRDASPEEREIWFEELKQRAPQDVREILALRHRFAPPRSSSFDEDVQFLSSEAEPPRKLPESSVVQASPIAPESQAQVAPAIEALRAAEQVLLKNLELQNAAIDAVQTELRRLREQLQVLEELSRKPDGPSTDD
jgi:hypothetical protein